MLYNIREQVGKKLLAISLQAPIALSINNKNI